MTEEVPRALTELLELLRAALSEPEPEHHCGTGWRYHKDPDSAPECCRQANLAYKRSRYRATRAKTAA